MLGADAGQRMLERLAPNALPNKESACNRAIRERNRRKTRNGFKWDSRKRRTKSCKKERDNNSTNERDAGRLFDYIVPAKGSKREPGKGSNKESKYRTARCGEDDRNNLERNSPCEKAAPRTARLSPSHDRHKNGHAKIASRKRCIPKRPADAAIRYRDKGGQKAVATIEGRPETAIKVSAKKRGDEGNDTKSGRDPHMPMTESLPIKGLSHKGEIGKGGKSDNAKASKEERLPGNGRVHEPINDDEGEEGRGEEEIRVRASDAFFHDASSGC